MKLERKNVYASLEITAESEGHQEDKASLIRAATWRYERRSVALQNEFYTRQQQLREGFLEEIAAIG
jgi:hypothetical protein